MDVEEYRRLGALELARLVQRGEAHPVEIVEAGLAAVERLNSALNAVILLDPERAREQAERVDRGAPLAGVPFLVKDNNLWVEGWPTTFSCRFYEGTAPRPDSELVGRLRRAGVVLIGKTNTPEFASDWTTEPTLRGATRNPWNLDRSPGGSSGGSAAAVASGMVPAAHGNDNGGSIRVPAAVCGLFGLKPSRGLVPVGPYFGELAAGLNSEHALTRSVGDSAALLDAVAGPEPGGRYQVRKSVPSYFAALDQQLGTMRIGVVTHAPRGGAIDPEIATAVERAAKLFEARGHSIHDIDFPDDSALMAEAEKVWFAEIALLVRLRAQELGREPQRSEIEAITAYAVERTAELGAIDYVEALHKLHAGASRVLVELRPYGLIITPTTGETAPRLGDFDTRTHPFDYAKWTERSTNFAPFTALFNVTGQPAASVPCGLAANGLPIGVQLVGRLGRDETVLAAARLIEQHFGPILLPVIA